MFVFKSGFIAILGRPNVGKSTFFNAVIGDKISIVADKPQTTRNRISGILNFPEAQLIFLDTPGMHNPKTPLNRAMVKAARDTIGDADLILMMVEADKPVGAQDLFLIEALAGVQAPVFLAINKTDRAEKSLLLPLMDQCRRLYDFAGIFPVSARTGNGLEALIHGIKEALPDGPRLFPDDIATEATERFIAGEFIREQILRLTSQEIPYASAVEIDLFKEDESKNLIRISATILVEKESQKAIMIGKKGALLKKIGTRARLAMENLFGAKVFLELFVRVKKDWTTSDKMLRELGLMK
ncbi:MAG TPA: GTPase Era [Smithellaceae bacterium]|jgi:GTP-binding protein Era|nr:GTPase Era [Syntrophaceae bacterium]NMC92256.1 GTPase Era [Smithella sp.]HOD63354.1 GTPase Era [Smithellaceae bacterium]MBP8665752.1 GTPase Era [Syntrophaceae bacterium]MBP9531750.1 GTPase Era [Syntrophaceae bacterium]